MRRAAIVLSSICCVAPTIRAQPASTLPTSPDASLRVDSLLHAGEFRNNDLSRWSIELERGGEVHAREGALDIDVPAGATVWFKPLLASPVMITYDAQVVMADGRNDRLSDLNCFWMARDSRNDDELFAVRRSGAFADYNALRTYYVGLGGNSNTTTRFRRYIGSPTTRPLLPEHDRRGANDLLIANQVEHLRLVAAGPIVRFYRGDRCLFDYRDPDPYTSGHFAFRTVSSHLRVSQFRVYRLATTQPSTP